ncbi:uncharacterized protein BX664DRAFT_263200 [Halteromyces radiatus]|uniref:uncharacterized protein n=1 Tax=Halteromyces radiatus TaxID=101107 RepID=UPI00221EDA4D|nr:uncharacterized protein BX664DRAFT_263200 [Halteromyces radiatus]KAI8088964.1 hypothetical protein BX664DRAFT_263200 [Halteromyces radiatus]
MEQPDIQNANSFNDNDSNISSQQYEDSDYDDESSYGEEESDDGNDLEDEPKLRYRRVGASVRDLLDRDTASTLKVSDKFVTLGTHWGAVHILDFEGHLVKSFQQHTATVNDISIDASEEYIASASDDGKVYIYALYTPEIQHFDYRRPVKSVAIDPDYAHKKTRQFVSGGMAEQLIMNEKGWLGHQNTVLHANEGPIYSIQWKNNFIAWANDTGVKVYDTISNLRITYIDRPAGSPRADLYKCRLVWKNDTTLMIGWADTVKVAVIKEKPKQLQTQGQPSHYMEIVTMFQTEYIISGISPFNDTILILAYMLDEDDTSLMEDDTQQNDTNHQRRRLASRPELHIIDPQLDNEEISADVLALNGYEHYQPNDYVLGFLAEEDMFYVMGPKDLIVARPRDVDDHIEWLMEHEKYGEALEAAQQAAATAQQNSVDISSISRFNVYDIGETYLNWLIKERQFETAAKECRNVLGKDKSLWEDWVFRFIEMSELKAIAPYIPTKDPQLGSTLYEIVLAWYMKTDQKVLLETIHRWPRELYNLSNIIVAVEDYLSKDQNNEILLECLADLYTYNNQPDKAIEYNLRLRRPNAFELIQEYNMFDAVKDKAVLLMEFDQHLIKKQDSSAKPNSMPAVQLLVKNTEAMQPAKIVRQLRSYPEFLYIYLDALFERDHHIGYEFHDIQVELYAEYDYSKLLNFLRTSHYISLEKAYHICEKKDLVPEMVFILGRMGNNKKALMLIINRLGDVQRAIDFAKEQKDDDLWEDLLTYSMDKPLFIRGLLENVGTDIEPLRLIKRIPDELEIPGLKEALLKILQDYNLQMSLHQGCEKILVSDSVFLADRMYKTQKRGINCQRKFFFFFKKKEV